jgi:hypothetical protein
VDSLDRGDRFDANRELRGDDLIGLAEAVERRQHLGLGHLDAGRLIEVRLDVVEQLLPRASR